jgi:hypothetical protein
MVANAVRSLFLLHNALLQIQRYFGDAATHVHVLEC